MMYFHRKISIEIRSIKFWKAINVVLGEFHFITLTTYVVNLHPKKRIRRIVSSVLRQGIQKKKGQIIFDGMIPSEVMITTWLTVWSINEGLSGHPQRNSVNPSWWIFGGYPENRQNHWYFQADLVI